MKRFDYLCILYSIALLAFGFDDNTPLQKSTAIEVKTNNHVQMIAFHEPAIAEHVATQQKLPHTDQSIKRVRLARMK